MRLVRQVVRMASNVTQPADPALPVSADVIGGGLLALLGAIHIFGLGLGGTVGFLALLVGWPLVAGSVAARLSTAAAAREVNGALAGTFGALTVTVLVLLTGVAGAWPSFVTSNIGVSLWPVTFVTLVLLTLSWTVFGYVGGYVADRLA